MAAARKTLGEGAIQRRGLVLRQVVAVETRLVGVFQALQALLVEVRELELVTINPVEDAKLHQCRIRLRCCVAINHLVASGRIGWCRSSAVVQWRRYPGTLAATIVRLPKAVNCLVDSVWRMWKAPRTRRRSKWTVALTAVVCHNRVVVAYTRDRSSHR